MNDNIFKFCLGQSRRNYLHHHIADNFACIADDKEKMKEVCTINGKYFEYASSSVKNDIEIAYISMKTHAPAIFHVAAELSSEISKTMIEHGLENQALALTRLYRTIELQRKLDNELQSKTAQARVKI